MVGFMILFIRSKLFLVNMCTASATYPTRRATYSGRRAKGCRTVLLYLLPYFFSMNSSMSLIALFSDTLRQSGKTLHFRVEPVAIAKTEDTQCRASIIICGIRQQIGEFY